MALLPNFFGTPQQVCGIFLRRYQYNIQRAIRLTCIIAHLLGFYSLCFHQQYGCHAAGHALSVEMS